VAALLVEIDAGRRLPYYLDLRTGFSNFAGSFDVQQPKQWGKLSRYSIHSVYLVYWYKSADTE
jgi:hypothetical protein